jgi:hypothetical protein
MMPTALFAVGDDQVADTEMAHVQEGIEAEGPGRDCSDRGAHDLADRRIQVRVHRQ